MVPSCSKARKKYAEVLWGVFSSSHRNCTTMAVSAGVEPATARLTAGCSAN